MPRHSNQIPKIESDPTITDTICQYISDGNYVQTACRAAGISQSTLNKYIRLAERAALAGEENTYTLFRDRLEDAYASAEVTILNEIRNAHRNGTSWQNLGWLLERTRNGRFGQKQVIEQNITVSGPPVLDDAPKDHDQWLERMKKRKVELSSDGQNNG
tara:strand:+ start:656 stop:1132 length:477 start_codon:yes stop_codon:yes gene_type:complete